MGDRSIYKNGKPYTGSYGSKDVSTVALSMKTIRDSDGNIISETTYKKKVDIVRSLTDKSTYHNGYFRGKDLTERFKSGDLITEIENGTYRDLYIGDYFVADTPSFRTYPELSQIRFRFAKFEKTIAYIVTDQCICSAKFSNTESTVDTIGYFVSGSWIYNYLFGSHAVGSRNNISYNENSDVVSGNGSGFPGCFTRHVSTSFAPAGYLTELEVYGSRIWSSSNDTNYRSQCQFPLFKLSPEFIVARNTDDTDSCSYWLKTPASITKGIIVGTDGRSVMENPTNMHGVRLVFTVGKW